MWTRSRLRSFWAAGQQPCQWSAVRGHTKHQLTVHSIRHCCKIHITFLKTYLFYGHFCRISWVTWHLNNSHSCFWCGPEGGTAHLGPIPVLSSSALASMPADSITGTADWKQFEKFAFGQVWRHGLQEMENINKRQTGLWLRKWWQCVICILIEQVPCQLTCIVLDLPDAMPADLHCRGLIWCCAGWPALSWTYLGPCRLIWVILDLSGVMPADLGCRGLIWCYASWPGLSWIYLVPVDLDWSGAMPADMCCPGLIWCQLSWIDPVPCRLTCVVLDWSGTSYPGLIRYHAGWPVLSWTDLVPVVLDWSGAMPADLCCLGLIWCQLSWIDPVPCQLTCVVLDWSGASCPRLIRCHTGWPVLSWSDLVPGPCDFRCPGEGL